MLRQIKLNLSFALLRRSLKRVGGAHLRVFAPKQHSFFRRYVAATANRCQQHCVQFDFSKFEPQTYRSKDGRVTVRPTLSLKLYFALRGCFCSFSRFFL